MTGYLLFTDARWLENITGYWTGTTLPWNDSTCMSRVSHRTLPPYSTGPTCRFLLPCIRSRPHSSRIPRLPVPTFSIRKEVTKVDNNFATWGCGFLPPMHHSWHRFGEFVGAFAPCSQPELRILTAGEVILFLMLSLDSSSEIAGNCLSTTSMPSFSSLFYTQAGRMVAVWCIFI